MPGLSSVTTTIADNDAKAVRISGDTAVTEGGTAQYTVSLGAGVGLGDGQSVSFTLDLTDLSASVREGIDYAGAVQLASDISGLGGVLLSTSVSGGVVTVVVTNNTGSDIAAGSGLATFGIAATDDLFAEASESYRVTLGGGAGVAVVPGSSSVTTTIADNDLLSIDMTGNAIVAEGSQAVYTVFLDGAGLGAGRRIDITLDTTGGANPDVDKNAQEGLDFAPLDVSSIVVDPRLSLVGAPSIGPNGEISLILANDSASDIDSGSQILQFDVQTNSDQVVEYSESFQVALTSTGSDVAAIASTLPLITYITDAPRGNTAVYGSPRIINFGDSVTGTIEPGVSVDVPVSRRDNPQLFASAPESLQGGFDYDLFFRYKTIVTKDATGAETFSYEFIKQDVSGLKVPLLISLPNVVSEAADYIVALGYPPGILTSGYKNALSLATLNLGAGNDVFSIIGQGITQKVAATVDIAASQGYIFQSTIDAGPGDDTVVALMPYESTFIGGSNTPYHDAANDPLGAGVPVLYGPQLSQEQLGVGDVLELKGSRFDWDIEFEDTGNDGVTLQSLLSDDPSVRDYITTSNNNRITGFERLRFGDILFDLITARQQDASAGYKQDDYYFGGVGAVASALNSDIASGSGLWEAFRFNRTRLSGIESSNSADPIDVYTGSGDDTPFVAGALRFASLNTESGNDIVNLGSADQASVTLGSGVDQLFVSGLFDSSSIDAGADIDNIVLTTVQSATVLAGLGSDVVEIKGSSQNSSYNAGEDPNGLDRDRLILPKDLASYGLVYSFDGSGGLVIRDSFGNIYVGFEVAQFRDVELDFSQGLSLVAAASSFDEGQTATYDLKLSGTGLQVGQGVEFTLQIGSESDTAQISTDLAELAISALSAVPGIELRNVTVDSANGLIKAQAAASSAFAIGSTIATLSIPINGDLLDDPAEFFTVTLRGYASPQAVVTTIANVKPVSIALSGPDSVSEGQSAAYSVSVADPSLSPGRSVTFNLDAGGVSATPSEDFLVRWVSAIESPANVSIVKAVDQAKNSVFVTATNIGSQPIGIGADLVSFQIPVVSDSTVEGPEDFIVNLSSTTALIAAGGASVSTTITDLVPAVTISLIGETTVLEGGSASYAVLLDSAALLVNQSINLTLDISAVTALKGVDFLAVEPDSLLAPDGVSLTVAPPLPGSGVLQVRLINTGGTVIQSGAQLLSFQVSSVPDQNVELDETYTVSLASSDVSVAAGSATVTTSIIDDDPSLRIRLDGVSSVPEGQNATYAVVLDGVALNAGRSVIFQLDSQSGTATENLDFNALDLGAIEASPGLVIASITKDPVSKALTVVVTNNGATELPVGSQLVFLTLPTISDQVADIGESFSVSLQSNQATVTNGLISTVISAPLTTSAAGTDSPSTPTTEPAPLPGGGSFIVASPLKAGPQQLLGTAQSDSIVGSVGPDNLDGGPGVDQLTGGLGTDTFKLTYGDRAADVLTDFTSGEDKILIQNVVRGSRLASILDGKTRSRNVLDTVKSSSAAARSKYLYVYDEISGRLYFNSNGSRKGFGSGGGLVAELPPFAGLSSGDLQFSYAPSA